MLERIIQWSGHHPGLVIALNLAAVLAALVSIQKIPLDALPDVSDTQVIVFSEWMGRSPTLIEDQVTYPVTTTFLSAPKVKAVRSFTMFGMSFVYVIFEDGTDMYWARSRVLEYLSSLQGRLPPGVTPRIGPDATGVGWVFQYALIDRTGKQDLSDLRSLQDWYIRYALASVPGVAEVASVGGFEKQYQVTIDPARLLAYELSLREIIESIRMSNLDVGGRVLELAEHEYAVRGRGYISGASDLEKVVVGSNNKGTPIWLADIARIQIGKNIRRGFAELNGEGEVAGGIIVMRPGENALDVIDRVKERIAELKPSLPDGVELVVTYDRSGLIRESVATLRNALAAALAVVVVVTALMLLHLRSSLIGFLMLPTAVLLSFIPMQLLGVSISIMALSGIILALGDMVDAPIVLIENAHRKLEGVGPAENRTKVILDSAKDLGPPIFGALLIIAVSFLPVFMLEAQEGKLFKPLAYTKTFSMGFAALLSVTLVPALMVLLIRGRIHVGDHHPINKILMRLYRPALKLVLRRRFIAVIVTTVAIAATVPMFSRLGSEFMPPLYEGTLLFMPVSVPGISIEEAKRVVSIQNRILKTFPEVETVFGKAGRAETATDPAPLSMIETVVVLKPKHDWRSGLTLEKLVSHFSEALETPGFQSAWTMPVRARVDMLTTGIRTPIGIKVFGPDLSKIAEIGEQLEAVLREVPGTRSVYAERELGGFYLDFIPDRSEIARYGLRVMDVFDVVETAIGGLEIDRTIEGRERYTVNVRYPRGLRDSIQSLERVLVTTMSGAQVPLAQLGHFETVVGPPMIKSEAGSLVGWVFVDVVGRDLGGYVKTAKAAVANQFKLPKGYRVVWTGQYEFMERVRKRMQYVIPLTLLIVFVILYINIGGVIQTFLVMSSVPFALVGSVWLLALLNYNTSIAVYVGMIALVGIAAETALVMVVYLDNAYAQWRADGKLQTADDLIPMVMEAASLRIRPVAMMMLTNIAALIPIMWATGTGADVAKRIASPMWGGLISLTILTLFIIPVLYIMWRRWEGRKEWRQPPNNPDGS